MSIVSSHWFDAVAIAVIALGIYVGKRKEALPQLLSFSHWVLTLFICSFLYQAPAIWVGKALRQQPDIMALIIFPIEFVLVYFALSFIRRRLAKNIDKKEPFGTWEFHITKGAGAARFFAMLLVVMAWISGRYVTAADLRDHEIFCEENFGGISFPVLSTIQDDVFNGSFTGRLAKTYFSPMLMTAIPRVDYGERPSAVKAAAKKRGIQIRELNSNFESKDEKSGTGADGQTKNQRDARQNAAEPTSSTKPPEGNVSNEPAYRALTLKGISGTGDRLIALINNQSFTVGESNFIKMENQKIKIRCVKILKDSALIQLEDKTDVIELILGVTTNLKGEAVSKN